MSPRATPPSWTEWTRNPSERSPQRKQFDDLLGELRKEGLIEVKGSLFVHLARYSYLQTKDANIDVRSFIRSVPDSLLGPLSPTYRQAEVDAVFRILEAAGLCTILASDEKGILQVVLTERQSDVERGRERASHAVVDYLRQVYERWDPASLILRASSFPTPLIVARETRVDPAYVSPGEFCTLVVDNPDSNETNRTPFLQETVDGSPALVAVLQIWPLPDNRGTEKSETPEFSVLIPSFITLSALVKDYCLPVLVEYFRSNEHHDLASEIQAKYSSYMHKYRERFSSASTLAAQDKIDKVLVSADPEGDVFASAVYVVSQVLRAALREKMSNLRAANNPVVYQSARIAYAHAMAIRVRKRHLEREAASRVQDEAALLARLKDSPRPLSLEELKKTPDAARNQELGKKYPSVLELLPLLGTKEGGLPPVFELFGNYVHREGLLRAFLESREKEMLAQRDRLSRLWAATGIPSAEQLILLDKDVSVEFLRLFEMVHQERVLAGNTMEFIRDFLPGERDLITLSRWLWPDGHRGAITPLEVITKGLDPVLYEDKDRLRRRSLAGVLGLTAQYARIVKDAWNLVLQNDGMFRYILRRIWALFGRRPQTSQKKKAESNNARIVTVEAEGRAPSSREADYKRLVAQCPILDDRPSLEAERSKTVSQWCLKLDEAAAEKTVRAVDAEVARYAIQVRPELYTEENSAKVALFLTEKSSLLSQVTGSRAYHRYLFLTALVKMAAYLGK